MSTCILRPEVFPPEIVMYSPQWPASNVDLHRTCKWLYMLWFTHFRERTLEELLSRHIAAHYFTNQHRLSMYLTASSVQWGTMCLYSTRQVDIQEAYTLCGRRHGNDGCRVLYCKAYSMIVDNSIRHGNHNIILCKKDVIGGVEYRLSISNTDPNLALLQLNDCSLLRYRDNTFYTISVLVDPLMGGLPMVLYLGILTFTPIDHAMGPHNNIIDDNYVTTRCMSATDVAINTVVQMLLYMRNQHAVRGPMFRDP